MRWWGDFEVPVGTGGRWRVGPLTMWVERRPVEWRVHHESTGNPLTSLREVVVPFDGAPSSTATQARFGTLGTSGLLRVRPRLADRSIVSRPESPFYLPPGEQITLFLSTPLWIELSLGDPAKPLMEIPAYRPSDTWFGPSTINGEMCYASRTSARLDVKELPLRPHRAVTAVRLRNSARDQLLFERICLPVPFLSLFADQGGSLWTEPVSVEREEDGAFAALRWDADPPEQAAGASRVSEPRVAVEKNLLTRAFGALLG